MAMAGTRRAEGTGWMRLQLCWREWCFENGSNQNFSSLQLRCKLVAMQILANCWCYSSSQYLVSGRCKRGVSSETAWIWSFSVINIDKVIAIRLYHWMW
ncbi:hypothetical protein KC19_VG308300 [Ceratodon purpureus]|uniref:Uncharacterized protein n=1 Tax=Ceratodon purpureus TaxID=3225 RepID=A0A8T0HWC4_CERPU|nr:hypothetical protein KC19_VG308300 [Ceratodon purpureus]